MPKITTPVPNLIQGISQQAPNVRLPDQAELQENAWGTVSTGLGKRPPVEHSDILNATRFGNLGSDPNLFVHTINRDVTERYQVIIFAEGSGPATGNLKVFDMLTGLEVTVNFPDGKAYLEGITGTGTQDMEAITVQDVTFILNKRETVEMDSASTSSRFPEGMVFVQTASKDFEYTVVIDAGGITDEFTVTAGTNDGTNDIMTKLHTALTDGVNGLNGSGTPFASPYDADWVVKVLENSGGSPEGNTILIARDTSDDFTMRISGPTGGIGFKGFKDKVQRFSDLPKIAPNGFRLEVIGGEAVDEDNYHIKFEATDTGLADRELSEGQWVEVAKLGIEEEFDKATMPHILIRESGGDFTFRQADGTDPLFNWRARSAGDDVTNAPPTFVDSEIKDIFLHKGRLGFISNDNVILSESGFPFNFWRTSVVVLLDGDPIDVAADSKRPAFFRHAAPFSEQLFILTDTNLQFTLIADGDALLTPASAVVRQTSSYQSVDARPEVSGKSLYFATRPGADGSNVQFSGLSEFVTFSVNESPEEALDLTSAIPRYITGDIVKMAASTNQNLLLILNNDVLSDTALRTTTTVWAYSYFWNGDQKIQSAWSEWELPGNVYNIDFIDNDLFAYVERSDGVFLEKINMSPNRKDTLIDDDTQVTTYLTHLDRRIDNTDTTEVYSVALDETTITTPFDYSANVQVWTGSDLASTGGIQLKVLSVTNDEIVVRGDHTSTSFYVGEPYTMRYRFSTVFPRVPSARGGIEVRRDGRYQLIGGRIQFTDTVFFKVEFTPEFGPTRTKVFDSKIIGQYQIGTVVAATGQMQFLSPGRNDATQIDIVNDSPFPSWITGAEFDGVFSPRTARRL